MADTRRNQQAVSGQDSARHLDSPEQRYYSAYEWSLNPVLSVRELFTRLRETLAHMETLRPSWQREECKANLYLFISAITCTVDDYLGGGPPSLLRFSVSFPRLRAFLLLLQKLIDAFHYLLTVPHKLRAARWRRRWTSSVDSACQVLIATAEPDSEHWSHWRKSIEQNITFDLPESLLDRYMQLPSGLRSQDLAHQDAIALGELFATSQTDRQRRILVIGPRTMGAYMAPLVSAKLKALGWTSVEWCTIRPKKGISRWERAGLRALASKDLQVLVVDESPNTGNTFSLILNLLRQLHTDSERIYLLAAMHPTRPGWHLSEDEETRGVTLIRLDAHGLHKNHLLDSASVLPLLKEYLSAAGWQEVELTQSRQTEELNIRLEEHFQDGFECRLKRVFDVHLKNGNQTSITKRILAKSVGWGWLGYHAYFSGTRLAEFVPEVLGLRNGILFTDWLERLDEDSRSAPTRPPIDRLAAYIAARVQNLRLSKDPCFEISRGYGWTGWGVLIEALKLGLGRYVARLNVAKLHRRLRRYMAPVPSLIDGQMNPADWIRTKDGYFKVDFEHHNFGRTELYIVDPAYDLACAVFEFKLSEQEEKELVQAYVHYSGDASVLDRILLWKLVHGEVVRSQATTAIGKDKRAQVVRRWHQRQFLARNFLVYQMNRFSASLLQSEPASQWNKNLCFMDLDGVFDSNVFDFPQATPSGLMALALLRAHGFSVILNTARSAKDVQQYCQTYRLPGGVSESGCIFVDAVGQTEVPLIDRVDADQLDSCREAIRTLPGAFIDPNYRTAIRAFRYVGDHTEELSETEVREVLDGQGLDRLVPIHTHADTTILPKGIGKGSGLLWVKRYLGLESERCVAIGDNDQDVEMLRAAEIAYALANSSSLVRELAATGQCKLTREGHQKGLLEAVQQFIHADGRTCEKCRIQILSAGGGGALIQALMDFSERSAVLQLLSKPNW